MTKLPEHAPRLQPLGRFAELTRCSGGHPTPDLLLGRQKQSGLSTC